MLASATAEKALAMTVSSSKKGSETDGDEDEEELENVPPSGGAAAKGKKVFEEDSGSNSSSSESSDYVMSTSSPADVAEALGATNARLVGGHMVGKLCFESGQHERTLLDEAGDSFCFPIMERRIMRTGAGHAIRCTEDLALKSYVAARCARRQMSVERGQPSRISELERRVAQLEREKNELDSSLSTTKADAESALQAACEESETAKVDAAEARQQLEAKSKELTEAECKHLAANQAINAYREAI